MVLGIVIAVVAFVIGVSSFAAFNHIVMLKHNVAKAWANVDVALRQRHDELPKLVAICKQYMLHERDLLERVVAARAAMVAPRERGDARALGPLEARLHDGVEQLLALAESYPALKADEQFQHLQRRISELETTIADRREFFNATVTLNNVKLAQFPYVLVASALGMRAFALFLPKS